MDKLWLSENFTVITLLQVRLEVSESSEWNNLLVVSWPLAPLARVLEEQPGSDKGRF